MSTNSQFGDRNLVGILQYVQFSYKWFTRLVAVTPVQVLTVPNAA
jgi:hypothetical protein